MPKPDFTLKFIKTAAELRRLSETLISLPAFALDIETVDWWNRHQERIALLQFAYRNDGKSRVVIVDALAGIDLEVLRSPLEQPSALKIIHNASFDAVRLNKHYKFNVAPVFDTMAAARRSGERKYSLQKQAEIHLQIRLDKSNQTSDWSRRPLDARQLHYAALDPLTTLLLYENQTKRGLTGDYRLKPPTDSVQNSLPLEEFPAHNPTSPIEENPSRPEPESLAAALLGIIAELPSRYSPNSLAVSIGADRIGVAGWIIDRRLGKDAEPDEEAIKTAIADLLESGLIKITQTRRMEASQAGFQLWQSLK